jgi:hypothetical protein
MDTFAEAFDYEIVVPLDAVPATGLEVQVLDQDNEPGDGELIGMVQLSRDDLLKTQRASPPILKTADSQVTRLELAVLPYTTMPRTGSWTVAANADLDELRRPDHSTFDVRAGELVRIAATGSYTVDNDRVEIDENGYAPGTEIDPTATTADSMAPGANRGGRRKTRADLETAPYGAAIALLGNSHSGYTTIVVGTCIVVTPATSGSIRVGVNDRDVRNNTGQLTFTVDVLPPTTDRWSAGATSACGAGPGKSPPF